MFQKKLFAEMLNKQNELNMLTCGRKWRGSICENSNKSINWRLAILDEASELLNSTPWKWWKYGKPDVWNEKLELVDLWHFVMSYAMSKESNEEIVNFTAKLLVRDLTPSMDSKSGMIVQLTSTDDWKQMIIILLSYGKKLGFGTGEVTDLYFLKNWLNTFRMDNGYREGTYIKVWKPVDSLVELEDNHILARFLDSEGTEASAKKRFIKEYSNL